MFANGKERTLNETKSLVTARQEELAPIRDKVKAIAKSMRESGLFDKEVNNFVDAVATYFEVAESLPYWPKQSGYGTLMQYLARYCDFSSGPDVWALKIVDPDNWDYAVATAMDHIKCSWSDLTVTYARLRRQLLAP